MLHKNGEKYSFLCVDKMLFILISELSFKSLFMSVWLFYPFESFKSLCYTSCQHYFSKFTCKLHILKCDVQFLGYSALNVNSVT